MKTKISLLATCIFVVLAGLVSPGVTGIVVTNAQATSCNWNFQGIVRVGPSTGTAVQGTLTVQVGKDGDLSGSLATSDNKTIGMVGQLTGRAINVAFEYQKPTASAPGQYIFGSGTFWTPVSSTNPCGDNMGGTFSGPQDGDIGDWRVCSGIPNSICPPLKSK